MQEAGHRQAKNLRLSPGLQLNQRQHLLWDQDKGMMAETQSLQTSCDFCYSPHAASLLQGLQELRSKSLLVDVVLCVDGKEIPCHRNVLATCSEYFRAMFCNGHRESKEYKVEISSVYANALQLLIDYAYTSKVNITTENAKQLLAAASFFQIQPVFEACAKFLTDHLSVRNCLEILNLGSMLSPELENEALLYAVEEFASVSKTAEFLHLTKDQLINLISSDDLGASEETAYTAVMTWINHDTRKRKKEMRELLELVRFPFMDKSYFLNNVMNSEAVRKSCQDIVTETVTYQMFPGEVQSPRTIPRHTSGVREAVVVIGGVKKRGVGRNRNVYSDSITMTCSSEPSRISWTTMTKTKQNNTSGIAVAVLGTSDIIVTGGHFSCRYVYLYQPELDSWSMLAFMNCNRYHHKLAVVQGKVYAIGGYDHALSEAPTLSSVEIYDRRLNNWTDDVALPEPKYRHAVAVLDGSIYAMGGCGSDYIKTSTVFRFSPGESQWHPQSNMPVEAHKISAVALNGSIYVAVQPTDVLCYKPGENGGSWSVVANGDISSFYGMTVYGGKIYICGGFRNDEGRSKILCFNPEAGSLQRVGTMAKGVYGHGCVTILMGNIHA